VSEVQVWVSDVAEPCAWEGAIVSRRSLIIEGSGKLCYHDSDVYSTIEIGVAEFSPSGNIHP
jgi:hypothetical protein